MAGYTTRSGAGAGGISARVVKRTPYFVAALARHRKQRRVLQRNVTFRHASARNRRLMARNSIAI